ncbi:MAG TPA: thrombospondin type 3 repeat-containing protein [Verrucomicrobiales bacterium]|nr:thrombospondin type 3 repeat-containing protein [Verrucomicrobiales bacterium]
MMKRFALLAALAASPIAAAPVALNGTMTYTQNFDSLGTESVPWVDDTVISGWYAQINNGTTPAGSAQATDGATDLSGLLNCGPAGGNDRALGSKVTSTGAFSNIAYGVLFHNTGASRVKLTSLQYTGELWRPAATANAPDRYAVYYSVSDAPITNLISGTNSSTPVAGAGYTAVGAGADWTHSSPVAAAPVDGNAPENRRTVTFSPAGIDVNPGQYLMIKWTDPNENAVSDGFEALDDVSLEFTEVNGFVAAAVSNITRNTGGTPDPLDDTFGFTVNVTGSGAISAAWTAPDVNPPAGNASTGPYSTPVVWTGFPISAAKTITIADSANATLNTSVTVSPPAILGVNELGAPGGVIPGDGTVPTGWVLDETNVTATLQSQTAQTDHVLNSSVIDLSSVAFVLFTCDLDSISGSSSGFEDLDFFSLDLIIDGGAPVSVLGPADENQDGKLRGAVAGAGKELQDNGAPNVTKTFQFSHLIPATANSVQIRITGNNNSVNETFLVKNMRLSTAPAMLFAVLAAPILTLDNKGTVNPLDDTFSAAVNIQAAGLGASTGWHSDEVPARTGLYSTANPVSFGPYSVSGGSRVVTLTDDLNPLIKSQTLTFNPPPLPTLAVTPPVNIVRHENGAGAEDDTITFDLTITGSNGGPGWSATGGSPASGTFGPDPVSFTYHVPQAGNLLQAVIADASYPAVTQTIPVPFPSRYIFGRLDLGAGFLSLASDLNTPPGAQWVNDPAARTLVMTAGVATDSVVTSELIDLSSTGDVQFTAKLRLQEISVGSNIETTDRFKAELVIDGVTHNLVTTWDTGDGSSAVTVGANGPPNGYINGYVGTAGTDLVTLDVYLDPPADYLAHATRDEFNLNAQPVTDQLDNTFPLSFSIPAAANSAQLLIYGAGFAGSETVTVSDVLFTTGAGSGDSDGDGVSDKNEAIMGTDPNNAADVLRLTQNPANPNQISFPSKANKFYRLYISDDAAEGTHLAAWKDAGLSTFIGDDTGKAFDISVLPAESRRFFRLHVMDTDGAGGLWPATYP